MDRRKFLQGLAAGAGAAFLLPRLARTAGASPTSTHRLAPQLAAAPSIIAPVAAPGPPAVVPTSADVTMFRGNPAHTFYGTGPIRDQLRILWTFQ
ncbi:MAG: hypothetical protein CVU59_08660, partial [Deltaproteobacteria bacterium HGW-Deltaproteobacteria-17]